MKKKSSSFPVVLVAAAALLDARERVLIAQRPQGKSMAGLWEFPGGKVNEGEIPEAALVREMKEELGIKIEAAALKPIAFASHTYKDFHLLMPLFLCRSWKGDPKTLEHTALEWVDVKDLFRYPMPEADIPLVASLKALL